MVDGMVSRVPDAVDDGSRILEQIRIAGPSIHEEALLPDLAVEPSHGDIGLGDYPRGAEKAGIVVPASACLATLSPAPRRLGSTVTGRIFSGQLGERCSLAVRTAAISSSGRPARAGSRRRSRISAPHVRRARALTFTFRQAR